MVTITVSRYLDKTLIKTFMIHSRQRVIFITDLNRMRITIKPVTVTALSLLNMITLQNTIGNG